MSRQTAECFAEVVFETQTGETQARRFRCHWSQHRSRKNPHGELQSPKHEIANAETGAIFETRIRGVADQIEAATGMNFDRFTRSMLLAQGGFSAFLQATADQRSPILEQLTGTEIYSQISIAVHERQKKEQTTRDLLLGEVSGIVVLEVEQEQELQQQLKDKRNLQPSLTDQVGQIQQAMNWLSAIDTLQKEIAALTQEEKTLRIASERFSAKRQQLELAQKASGLDSNYATLAEVRTQQLKDQGDLQTQEEALPEFEQANQLQAKSLDDAEQQTIQTKKQQQQAAPLIQQVRALDQHLAAQKKNITEAQELCQQDAQQITDNTEHKKTEQEKRQKTVDDGQHAKQYIKDHQQDEWLVSGLTGIEQQLDNVQAKQREINNTQAESEQAKTFLTQAVAQHAICIKERITQKQVLDTAIEEHKQSKTILTELLQGRALREYRDEKEGLLRERSFLVRISELEDYRKELEDGNPCPLCGAAEHPFADGNIPEQNAVDDKIIVLTKCISQAEQLEEKIQMLAAEENTAGNNRNDNELRVATAANEVKTSKEKHTALNESISTMQDAVDSLKQSIRQKILPLGIQENARKTISELREELRVRLRKWQESVEKTSDVEKQVAGIDSEVKRLDAVIETQRAGLLKRQHVLSDLQEEYGGADKQRQTLYADKNPNNEELALNQAVEQAEYIEKQQRSKQQQTQQILSSRKESIAALKLRIEPRSNQLQQLQLEFSSALQSIDFANEQQFLAARLNTQERSELASQAKQLDDKKTELDARLKDRQENLNSEQAKKRTEKTLVELTEEHGQAEETLQQLTGRIGQLTEQIKNNTTAQERIKEKQSVIEAQKKECLRWKKLHDLIGSADGKKYRNFAQGLTFELMVSHANQQLEKMTDRYLLVRDQHQPLELNVVDSYQAGEVRSTKNLSGGESFIVSLSLALGLSAMASKKVRVDSLFLDEGFGTLDEDALEAALEALAGLRQEGKLIGVISHVAALKERISCQIQVIPSTSGRSKISGSGCSFNSVA